MKRWQWIALLIVVLIVAFFGTIAGLVQMGVITNEQARQAVAQGLASAGAAVLFGVIGAVFWGLWRGLKWAFRSLRGHP